MGPLKHLSEPVALPEDKTTPPLVYPEADGGITVEWLYLTVTLPAHKTLADLHKLLTDPSGALAGTVWERA